MPLVEPSEVTSHRGDREAPLLDRGAPLLDQEAAGGRVRGDPPVPPHKEAVAGVRISRTVLFSWSISMFSAAPSASNLSLFQVSVALITRKFLIIE